MDYRSEIRNLVDKIVIRKGIFGARPTFENTKINNRLDFIRKVFWAAREHTFGVFEGIEGVDFVEAYRQKAVSIFEDIFDEAEKHYSEHCSLFLVRESEVGSRVETDYNLAHIPRLL